MKIKALAGLLLCFLTIIIGSTTWALDEAILTPTSDIVKPTEEQEFNAAMSVWFKHKYADGDKMLKEFAKKYPNSRWRAEAELHSGCYLTYIGRYAEAKPIFERLAKEFDGTPVKTKALLRLANIAEREVKTDDAINQYAKALQMDPTWDQFKYANYHARKLMMTRAGQQARINCGPVALAACLDAIGRNTEASLARDIKPTAEGVSLGVLEAQCAMYGVQAKPVEMTLDELPSAALPVLAYVEPKHFVAVLGVKDGKAQIEDSIQGNYEKPLDDLARIWSGKVLTFAPADNMKPLTLVASLESIGGCCGQIDEDECLGDSCECGQTSSGGAGFGGRGGGGCGGGGCGEDINQYAEKDKFLSAGRPTWQINVDNLNILVKDTPVFYSPGKGPSVAFTLTYSNENSNTGIFGRGWRSPYDMKVFFLPSDYPESPTLQVHRDNGRIETYEWDGQRYNPRSSTANYGYRDTIAKQADGSVVLSLRGGGKYSFIKEGESAEGRIRYIEDNVGNKVTCNYDTNGCLDSVVDANGGITDIITEGAGINERVRFIRIPRLVNGVWVPWSESDPESRQAELRYTDGNLTYIKDMLEDASTLSYNAMLFYTAQTTSRTTITQAITTTSPANGEVIQVSSTDGFFASGKIKINNDEEITYTGKTTKSFTGITRGAVPKAASSGSSVVQVVPSTALTGAITATSPANGGSLNVNSTASFPASGWIGINGTNETIHYSGKTATSLTGITRGEPAYAAGSGSPVYLCSQSPYLSEIVTPSKKSKFAYEWYSYPGIVPPVAGIHEVYECGPTESYPAIPTTHYAWCYSSYETRETRYPTALHSGTRNQCDSSSAHWTGGRTVVYNFNAAFYDATNFIKDELGNTVVDYDYNDKRDRTAIKDASGNTTLYFYSKNKSIGTGDGKHNMYFRRDPLGNEWAYTYYEDHNLHTEADAYGRLVRTYSYNAAGQVTRIDTPLGAQVINHYDAQGRLDYSTDARGKTTHYHYNENNETRGLLTSVHDPEDKATLYSYDENGRRKQVTDPNGNVTSYEYDDLDRVTKVINHDSTFTETKYTCCHKVYQQDENGRRVYYVYDAKVRPYKTIASAKSTTLATSITTAVPVNGGSLAVASVSDFPNSGKVVVLDEIISYTGRDLQNNLLTGITRGVDGTRRVEVDSGFAAGRVDTVQVTYGYHPQYLDWMTALTDAMNHTTYYTYYLNGKQETIRYPDDKGERYTYDNNNSGNNLIKKEYGTFTGTYPDQTFTPNSNLTVNYEYDKNNRLLRSYH